MQGKLYNYLSSDGKVRHRELSFIEQSYKKLVTL